MLHTKLHDDVVEIVLDAPPVNALGAAMRQALDRAIVTAQADAQIKAIVIRGEGKLFSGGADITEFGQQPVEPHLSLLVESIEQCIKPVIAAIHGVCFGGGLELALSCHYRIAAPSAKLGLPEVKLGLLPGAGGTQRLPRLIGPEAALGLIVSGDPVSAQQALKLGLVDRLVDENALVLSAIGYAREVSGPRRTGSMIATAEPALFERFAADNARKLKGRDAPVACIEAVRAATQLPLAAGLAKERALFMHLLGGTQSAALRHLFFAERSAAKVDGIARDTALRPITSVGIIGAGTMGGGIAMNFLSVGVPVTIVEMAQAALDRGVATIRRNYEATAAKGRMTVQQVEAAMALLVPTLDFAALASCDLVIEAVYEDMAVKQDIFRRLDDVARPGAILASNTSYLDIDQIAAVTRRPHDVLGLHFFSPANVMKLVEVVRGAQTAPPVLATAMALARRIAKIAVVSGVCYGFIGNRMLMPRQEQANALLLEGATPQQVDRVHTQFGMPMGPFQMADLAGTDIGWHRDPQRITSLRDALCAAGRFGQKSGGGFYDYDAQRRPSPSPAVDVMIAGFRKDVPRAIDDEEIVVRTFYTMVNEASRILEEGIAQRASDIDVVWAFGYGWPIATGGPMFWADTIGLDAVVAGLEKYRGRLGQDFTVSPLLADNARSGRRFTR